MKGRDKLFFNLLTFLILVVVILVGVKTNEADKQIKRCQADIVRRQERGYHDPQLKETVDKLEADLRARLSEQFAVAGDPLDLTRVIRTKKFLKKIGMETAETENKMRLSATIVGKSGTQAVVKYRGRSQMVSVGEKLGGYRVSYIGKNKVTIVRGNETLTLTTEKAPDSIAELERLFGPYGENKPKVTVKEIPAEDL